MNDFLTFNHFSIVSKAHAAGANFWDGNRDIIKMNLSNPNGTKENQKGFYDARNYLYGVATYWSELIQTDLILKTAALKDSEKAAIAKNNDIDDFKEIASSLHEMRFPILEQDKTVEDYVEAFPLQSLETNPDLSAVFAQPDFQKEFFDKLTFEKVSKIVNEALDKAIPDKYKDNPEYRTYAVKAYSNKLIRNLLIGAMCPLALNVEGGTNLEQLKEVSIHSLGAQKALNVEEERRIVENKIKRAINPSVLENTINSISKELNNIGLDDFKKAEVIVLKGKAGLNWRFDASRDIGDLDSVRDGNNSFDFIWNGDGQTPGVQDFWTNFIHNIKTYNPSAYIISELTNMGWFPWNLSNKEFNAKLFKQGLDNDQMAASVERDFMNKTGTTTISNYNHYFNNLSKFAGRDPEFGSDVNGTAGNIRTLKEKVDEMLSQYQPNAAMLSHVFVDNHDKPRLLHAMPIDTQLFLIEDLSKTDNQDARAKARFITGRDDYQNISAAAVAVGIEMRNLIDKKYKNSPKHDKLVESLTNLVNGKVKSTSMPNYRRADAFGHLPYEITIRDLFKGAGIDDEEEMLNFRFDFMKKYMEADIKLWEVMNAIVGTPTLFNGTEFFQTGYETPSKNFYIANRNQTMHEMKNDKRFGKYYETMQNITGLYKKPDLSAIRSGFPISGAVEHQNGVDIWPIYKSDEKGSKVITLVTNNGVPKGDVRTSSFSNKSYSVDSLNLDFGGEVLDNELPLKRIYLNSEGKYVQDSTDYVLTKQVNNSKVTYKIEAKNGKKINLQGTVETFYFPKSSLKGKYLPR